MAKIFANSGDPDQTPRSVTSDLGLHCLPISFLGVSRLQIVKWDKITCESFYRSVTYQSLKEIGWN